MVESHCEILWENNLGAVLGRQPTAYYGAEADETETHALISQQHFK